MTARRLGRSSRLVVSRREYLSCGGVPLTPADLSHHQAIVYSQRGGGQTWTFSQGGSNVEATLSELVRVSAGEGMRTAVFGGTGLAVASRWMFSPELASGKIETLLTDWTSPTVDQWAVFPSGRLVTAQTVSKHLFEWLE